MKFVSGAVYKRDIWVFVLVYFGKNKNEESLYGMLHIHRHAIKGMSAPLFQFGKNSEFIFSERELIEQFNAENWKMLDGRLRIEKIDDMSLVEYTIGKLEEKEL